MKLLIFSDIHGDRAALERLLETEADYYFAAGDLVNWAKGFDHVGPILQRRAGKVYVIPGNHESAQDVAEFCGTYGFEDFHGRQMKIGEWNVAGLGYSNPTPFDTPGEYSEAEMGERLEKFAALDPLVMICHCPPRGTALDDSGEGNHFGSTAMRAFIEKAKPRYFFCGHIHEAAGVSEEFGGTWAMNVGKKGYLLEL